MMDTLNPLYHQTAALAQAFSGAAWLFTYPDAEQAREKVSLEFLSLMEGLIREAGIGNPELGVRGWKFRESRQRVLGKEEADDLGEALRVEFSRLFVTPPPRIPLLGSKWLQHRTPESRSKGESVAVRDVYRSLGLRNQSGVNEPGDHLVSELDFAAYVTAAEARAWGEGNAASARDWSLLRETFIAEHLGELALGVAKATEDLTQDPFLRYHAALLRTVVNAGAHR